jgi:hypothetical protein
MAYEHWRIIPGSSLLNSALGATRFLVSGLPACFLTSTPKLGRKSDELYEFLQPLSRREFKVLAQQAAIDIAHVLLDPGFVHAWPTLSPLLRSVNILSADARIFQGAAV